MVVGSTPKRYQLSNGNIAAKPVFW